MARDLTPVDVEWLAELPLSGITKRVGPHASALLLERRAVLLGMGATAVAALLPGCSSKAEVSAPAAGASTQFDGLRSLRDLIRTSPDHLSARAAEVIASKDFSSAVRFVRDQIGVLPPPHPTDSATDAVRWGPDATLRAGAGTVRERAELLKSMLVAMGATARLVYADWPTSIDAAALYGATLPSFAVDPTKLGASLAPQFTHINDPLPDPDSSAVVASLLGLIPAGQAVVARPYDGLDTRTPLVEYVAGGVTKWAFALGMMDEVATAPAGLGTIELSPASYPKVSVRLLAALGNLPGVATPSGLVELVAGSWTADQLTGSRLLVALSGADPDHTVGTPPDQLLVRLPTISVKPPTPLTGAGDPKLWSPSAGLAAPAGATGYPVTLSGAVFTAPAQAGDPPLGPYGAMQQLDAAAHAAALASVATLEATANGGAFPDVLLTVSALDQSGAPVFGLVQSDFTITDEGSAETAMMLSNAGVESVKVLLAYDCSGSVLNTPAEKMAFDTQLSNALLASAQTTPFLLGVASLGTAPGDGYLAPDASTIAADIAACTPFSDLWTTLGQIAPDAGCSAVVISSDFQASDDPAAIPALQQRLAASGLSVALVPISTVDQSTVDAIVQLCGAVVLDASAADFQTKLSDFVNGVTAREKASGYRFGYRLPADQQTNQSTRTAQISLATRSAVSAAAPYAVPVAASRGNIGFAGLYLELTVGVGSPVTRRLSGPRLDRFGFSTPVTAVPTDYDATRELAGGLITVALEPGSPTSGANAEDLISSMLSFEPLLNAGGKTQAEALAAGKEIQAYAATLSLLVDRLPVQGKDPPVAPELLRVVVMTEASGEQGLTRRLDVVPELNFSVAATTDGAAAFTSTLRKTVGVSLRESMLLPSSAASALSGASLQYLAPSANPTTLTGFSASDLALWAPLFDQYGSWHCFVPTTPAPGAMWIVDPNTGSAVAVFIDGTGGGAGSGGSCNQAALAAAFNLFSLYCSYTQSTCSAGGSISCDGAVTGSVGATVLVAFAIQPIDIHQAADVMLLCISLLSSAIPGGIGWALSSFSYVSSGLSATKCTS